MCSLLVGNLCQLGAHQIQVGIDGLLVVLIDLGQGEQRDKGCRRRWKIQLYYNIHIIYRVFTQYDQSHAIEPGANVGEHPQNDTELNRIDQILNEEQASQLSSEAIQMCNTNASNVLNLLLRQRQIQFKVFPIEQMYV